MAPRALSDADLEALRGWPPGVAPSDLVEYFPLDVGDLRWVRSHRGAATRLGLGVQLCALRFLGFVPTDLACCPRQYAAIADPLSFSSELGERMRTQVSEAADALAQAPAPPDATTPEGWVQRLGEANMAGLMTEERVFSEMVWTVFPSETAEEDEGHWTPLLPDSSALARAEAEDRHL